jgi:transcriptional repressor NrdR
MRCPVCNSPHNKVLDSRDGPEGDIRRRRQCSDCAHRFTTRERIEETLPVVVKRDGKRQNFDRTKIRRGLELACRKRPVTREAIEDAVRQIERWVSTRSDKEIESDLLGERIMHHLYSLDQVAYVRFVSVYRSFDSVEEFERLLVEMEKAERVNIRGQRTMFDGDEGEAEPGIAVAARVGSTARGDGAGEE